METIAAVIVTYNVDEEFKNRVSKVQTEVDRIIIVDNGSNEVTLNILKDLDKNIKVIYLEENKGIAYALNEGIKYVIDKGYSWILTLDQDSIITKNMINNMLRCYNNFNDYEKSKIAMLVPIHIEKNQVSTNNIVSDVIFNEVLTEITSGALTKSEVYKNIGLYDEKLFIDLVDHDYCLNLNEKCMKIIQVNNAILIHNLGKSVQKKILGLTMTPTNHSPLRRYYMTRNRMYIWNKYKKQFPQWVSLDKKRFLSENMKILLFEDNKIEKIRFIVRGVSDYKKNIFGKFNDIK